MLEQLKESSREVRQALGTPVAVNTTVMSKEMERLLSNHLKAQDQTLQQAFKKQEATLGDLEERLDQLTRRSRARHRGVPWSLVILGVAGYVLWNNTAAREKVMGLVQQAVGKKSGEASDIGTQASPAATPPLLRIEEPIAVQPLMVQPPQTPGADDQAPVDPTVTQNKA